MLSPDTNLPPSIADQLKGTSRDPTIAASSSSMMEEKEARSSLSSQTQQRSFYGDNAESSGPSVIENEVPETEEKPGSLSRADTAATKNGGDPLQQTETREDGSAYPTGAKLALISGALCLSVFLTALDNSIIATAIPAITDHFHSLPDVGWYGSAYLLTTASLQLLFGKFYTYFSIKWVYITAILLFELGSLVCGVAPSSNALIIGRAIAGLGSSGIFSGALLILAHSVPLPKRPVFSGMIGGVYGISSVAGPLLGGVFTDKVTWRWCFYINLPIGAVTVLLISFFFPDPKQTKPNVDETLWQRIMRFDPFGTFIFIPAIVSLLLALQWGGTMYPFYNGRIIALFVVFGVLIITFLFIQWKQQDDATVPPRIIKQRSVLAAALYAFCIGSSFFLFVYYIPTWFQAVQSVSAVESGIRNLPLLLAVVLASLISGGLVTAFGYYNPFMIFGTVLASIGGGLLTLFHPNISEGKWIGFQIIFGFGIGIGLQQPLIAVQTVLDIKDVPTGTAVVVFAQTIGGALFVSVGNNLFDNKLVQELTKNVPSLNPQEVIAAGATGLQKTIAPALLPLVKLSYSNALVRPFQAATALAALSVFGSLLIEWKSVKGKKIEPGMA
ncbi:major facilitator superfamily domain-containing protein [Xylariaceae sp. FL0255]|nr:major facilitator superfamily domain-containing protein [Xylariaceae sp. FL0255]